jgi:hypothetical protein
MSNVGAGSIELSVKGNTKTETLKITNLPTTDPVDAGAIWNDNGTLKISSGS